MINLSDLSVVIAFRHDSADRLENLWTIVRYFAKFATGYELIVLENGPLSLASELASDAQAKYVFERNDGPFHRTRILNRGIERLSSRRFVANFDADSLVYPAALVKTMTLLRDGGEFVLPFSGELFELRGRARAFFIASLDFATLKPPLYRRTLGSGAADVVRLRRSHVGGAHFFEKKAFLERGGYNENFIAWGYEDNEIVDRFGKLGCAALKVHDWPILHLAHRRGTESSKVNPYYRSNFLEYRRMSGFTPDQIRAAIQAGALKLEDLPVTGRLARIESRIWGFAARLGLI